ncbi:MAG: response regulator [Ginsengibacter sp.]
MSAKPSRILVIDDNDDILFMLQAMLQLKAYQVFIKNNIEDIESFIMVISPEIILMDILLGGADGHEICKRLKADPALSHIPIIMISAHSHAEAECLEAGASYFLEKPFEIKDIYHAITYVLGREYAS